MILERGHRLLPTASALAGVSAFPPFHFLIPSFVALVPLAVWVADQNDLGDGSVPLRVFRGGVWFGVLYFGLLLYWMPLALAAFTWWAVPAYLTTIMVLALGAGCFTWALHRLTHFGRVPLWLALPLTWTAALLALVFAKPIWERPSRATPNSWARPSWLVRAGSRCGSPCSTG